MTLPGTPITSLPGCSIEPIEHRGTPIVCVMGCLLTEAGEAIKREMIEQFRKKYDIIAVNQEPPGKFYEFPALSFAQSVSIKSGKPVLYVHTKGASNLIPDTDNKNERMFSKIPTNAKKQIGKWLLECYGIIHLYKNIRII